MKKIYMKPIAGEEMMISLDSLMITASGDGTNLVDNGGTTSGGNISEGDARQYNLWEDDEEENF